MWKDDFKTYNDDDSFFMTRKSHIIFISTSSLLLFDFSTLLFLLKTHNLLCLIKRVLQTCASNWSTEKKIRNSFLIYCDSLGHTSVKHLKNFLFSQENFTESNFSFFTVLTIFTPMRTAFRLKFMTLFSQFVAISWILPKNFLVALFFHSSFL